MASASALLNNLPLVATAILLLAASVHLTTAPALAALLQRVGLHDGFAPRAALLVAYVALFATAFAWAYANPRAETWVFGPLAAITILLRAAAPAATYQRLRTRATHAAPWPARLAPHLFGLAAMALLTLLALADLGLLKDAAARSAVRLGEQAAAALVVAFAFSRAYLRLLRRHPGHALHHWRVWGAAFLVAVAFILLLPAFVPAFAAGFTLAGYAGWGLVAAWTLKDWSAPHPASRGDAEPTEAEPAQNS